MGDESLPPILRRRVAGLAGARPVHARLITGGLTLNRRWEVTFDNGTTAFLKVAVNEKTAAWLRTEALVYSSCRADFLPRMIGWSDESRPILLLEDLSSALWPDESNWTAERIEQVLQVLRSLHELAPPPGLAGVRVFCKTSATTSAPKPPTRPLPPLRPTPTPPSSTTSRLRQ